MPCSLRLRSHWAFLHVPAVRSRRICAFCVVVGRELMGSVPEPCSVPRNGGFCVPGCESDLTAHVQYKHAHNGTPRLSVAWLLVSSWFRKCKRASRMPVACMSWSSAAVSGNLQPLPSRAAAWLDAALRVVTASLSPAYNRAHCNLCSQH